MKTLWLTYAWKDNEQADIDYIIGQLRSPDMSVNFDRAQLVAGRRIWDQIDKAIIDPARCDGWAIVATRNSLVSEACQEELAYALDRALRARGDFPLIGIFPEPIDRSLVPSSLASRLYVSLNDPQWANRVRDAVQGSRTVEIPTQVVPYHLTWHERGQKILEVRPRSGRWYPFHILVPATERERLGPVLVGPYGVPPGAGMTSESEATISSDEGSWSGLRIHHAVDPLNSAFAYFPPATPPPSRIVFGQLPQLYLLEGMRSAM
jgi:hypothetical protein